MKAEWRVKGLTLAFMDGSDLSDLIITKQACSQQITITFEYFKDL